MRFVLDASVTLGWAIDQPISTYAERVRSRLLAGERAVVPSLWHLEVASAIRVAERRQILTENEADIVAQRLTAMLAGPIETHPDTIEMKRAFSAARVFDLTPYDATYVLVARELGLPLATLDKSLRSACARAGVALQK